MFESSDTSYSCVNVATMVYDMVYDYSVANKYTYVLRIQYYCMHMQCNVLRLNCIENTDIIQILTYSTSSSSFSKSTACVQPSFVILWASSHGRSTTSKVHIWKGKYFKLKRLRYCRVHIVIWCGSHNIQPLVARLLEDSLTLVDVGWQYSGRNRTKPGMYIPGRVSSLPPCLKFHSWKTCKCVCLTHDVKFIIHLSLHMACPGSVELEKQPSDRWLEETSLLLCRIYTLKS